MDRSSECENEKTLNGKKMQRLFAVMRDHTILEMSERKIFMDLRLTSDQPMTDWRTKCVNDDQYFSHFKYSLIIAVLLTLTYSIESAETTIFRKLSQLIETQLLVIIVYTGLSNGSSCVFPQCFAFK